MSQATPPPAALRKLPVLRTVAEAYGRVFGNLDLVVRASLFPFALTLLLITVSFIAPQSRLLTGLVIMIGFLPYTIFGVAWHRVTLLGPAAGAPKLVPTWARRHWRFLGYLVTVTLIGYGAAVMVLSIAITVFRPSADTIPLAWSLGLIVGVIILAYVMIRLGFVFPAVAVDEAYRLGHSWTHTKGQGLRLLGAVVVTAVPMLTLLWVVSAMFGAILVDGLGGAAGPEGVAPEARMEAFVEQNLATLFVSQVLMAGINYVLMALVVSVMSIAFRTCTGWVPAAVGMVTLDGEES